MFCQSVKWCLRGAPVLCKSLKAWWLDWPNLKACLLWTLPLKNVLSGMKGIQDCRITLLAYLIYEVRAPRREGPKNWASECVCVLKGMKEGGREGETKSHRLKGGRGYDYRDERLNDASEQSRRSWVTGALCLVEGERGGFRFSFPAVGLGRGRARQANGDRRRSMGHSASSETVAQQPAQHNTGESEAGGSVLNGWRKHHFRWF